MRFNHDAPDLQGAFNITEEDKKALDRVSSYFPDGKFSKITWCIQRALIDETLSDRARCYMIFTLGRFYQIMKDEEGGERKRP